MKARNRLSATRKRSGCRPHANWPIGQPIRTQGSELGAGNTIVSPCLILDVADEALFQDCLKEFGDTPIKVRTASGKFHAYYKHNGERRQIRPINGLEADILGSGVVVLPPSRRPGKGAYEFLEGSERDLDRLPVMRGVDSTSRHLNRRDATLSHVPGACTVHEGERDAFIFREGRLFAPVASGPEQIYDHLSTLNAERCLPSLPDSVIVTKARHIWQMKERGELILPGDRTGRLPLETIIALSGKPSAFLLLAYLKAHHPPHHEFQIVPEGISQVLNISPRTISTATKWLLEQGELECTFKADRVGAANRYRLKSPHAKFADNRTDTHLSDPLDLKNGKNS